MDQIRQIEELFRSKIPLTVAMDVSVESYQDGRLVLHAPLEANINHVGTAFGGSLNTLAVLCGYGVLWLEMRDLESHIIIRESTIKYERPVRGDLTAICVQPDAKTLEEFKQRFLEKGKSRIAVSVTIESNHQVAARFEGTFVAVGSDY